MNVLRIVPALMLLLSSCDFSPKDKVIPKWEMDIFGPLVKADLNIQNISELEDLEASVSVSPATFGLPALGAVPPTPSPGISTPAMPVDLTDAFSSAVFESGELYFRIKNDLQINIQNATIQFSGGTLNINQPVSNIAANGGTYVSPATSLANVSITSPLNLRVLNFRTAGGAITDAGRKLTVELFLRNVKVKSITVSVSDNFSITDTSDFNIRGKKIESESVTGVFNTYITNNFPLHLDFQIYFMDASKTIVLDSLFDSGNETVLGGAGEKKFVTTVSGNKINNLNKAEFARIVLKLSAPPSGTIVIQDNVFVKAQVVGDLRVQVTEE